MIEKYFLTGLCVTWSPPAGGSQRAGAPDGSIIDNPPVGTPAMVYDYMDGEMYDLTAPHVKTVGLSKAMHIPHDWLVYAAGYTTKMPLLSDTLTGYMSGCPIVVWSKNGAQNVGHVGTSNEYPQFNGAVKTAIGAELPNSATGFFPAAAWSKDEQADAASKFKKVAVIPRILALVTSTGTFYSILMMQRSKPLTEFVVAGIRKVGALDGSALKAELAKK